MEEEAVENMSSEDCQCADYGNRQCDQEDEEEEDAYVFVSMALTRVV